MQCPVCSEDIDASGGRIQLTRHIRNIHGHALKDADRLSRSAVAPTASDPAAELVALRDEVRRLREAMSEALVIIDEQAPALTGWRARDVMAALRAALEVTK